MRGQEKAPLGCGASRAGPSDTLELDTPEEATRFDPLTSFDIISWDYTFTSHSPRGHPLEPLRHELAGQRIPDAATVRRLKDGRRIRYAGLVISRQRPGTAKGVVFMTLKPETFLRIKAKPA